MQMFNPPHPGLIIRDALESIPMTVTEFAAHLGVARSTLSRVMNGRAGITADMSIRLSAAFGQKSPDLWFKMQNTYDFWQAAHARPKVKVQRLKGQRHQIAA
jgi:addiction module HigA family antidote